jgi:hypothetical protein
MFGKAIKNIGRGISRSLKPAPKKPFSPPAGGLGAGFGGGAGAAPGNLPFMSDAKRAGAAPAKNPMSAIQNSIKQAVANKNQQTAVKNVAGRVSGLGGKVMGAMMKKGGEVKASKAPKASSASKRADGIATKGKTKGRIV